MNLKTLTAALTIALSCFTPILAQTPPAESLEIQAVKEIEDQITNLTKDLEFIRKNVNNPAELAKHEKGINLQIANYKRQLVVAKRIADLAADLDYIEKNIKDSGERSRQQAFVKQQIENFRGQLKTLRNEKLGDTTSSSSGTGNGSGATTEGQGSSSPVADAIFQITQKELNEQQLKLYIKTKEDVLKRLPQAQTYRLKQLLAKKQNRDFGIEDDDGKPLKQEDVPEEMLIELVRFHYDAYYSAARINRGKIENLGYYESRGKRIDVPGLRVLKVKKLVYADDDSDMRVEKEVYEYPSTIGASAPEIWPMLFGEKR